jgi:hypothetical protein
MCICKNFSMFMYGSMLSLQPHVTHTCLMLWNVVKCGYAIVFYDWMVDACAFKCVRLGLNVAVRLLFLIGS